MQNWDNMQAAATYEQHNNNNNNWYNSMLAKTEIKTEPDTESRMHEQQTVMTTTTNATMTTMKHKSSATSDVMSHLENYLRQQQQQQVQQQPQTPQQQQMSTVDALNAAMTPSPSNTDSMQQLVYDSGMQTQLLQQQQYQQQFQQAQHAAAHNQVTSTTPHLPLGFNPLTPPGLPTAIIPSITHFYHQQQQQQHHSASNNARHSGQQTPSPQPLHALAHTHAHMLQQPTTPMDSSEKLQSALTPRNTPPMDITPPKSPTKSQIAHLAEAIHLQQQQQQEKQQQEQDAQSDTSDDMKYSTGELDDEKMIREPIYNSHGKIKNYKCKSCGLIAITKVLFWEHASTHMKPEKILQCPKCPFVTELKHHLEYHIRKHKNLKPFQCDKCSYTCVNKSMLNSHRKSHSSVYQYRCADCDYATKYCHSFKLHLRKYDHKPGLVLDEEGLPNPSVVIDVYGTRRGPKSKGGAGGNKRSNSHTSLDRLHAPKCQENSGTEFKLSASQFSAALQSFSMPTQQQHQMPVSPAKSPSSLSSSSELQATRAHSTGLSQQQQQQQQKQQQMHALTHATQAKLQRQPSMQQNLKHLNPTQASTELTDAKSSMSSLLPPLATILQQNPNMAFFPYWNLNLQMLAAQQQAAALAQMPTNMREKALQELQNLHTNKETYLVRSPTQHAADNEVSDNDADDDDADDADDDDDQSDDRKSTDSAMDLSQGSPVKEDIEQQQRRTPAACMKLHDESNDTPIVSVNGAARRKGRVLKLDATLHVKSASAESLVSEEETIKKSAHEHVSASQASSPIPNRAAQVREEEEEEVAEIGSPNACAPPIAMDMDSAEVAVNEHLTKPVSAACTSSTSTNSTASSSGNSSNGSSSTASQTSTTGNGPPALGTMYECKYCDIYFKDAVLYTIHMGYHSCDDVFKCNMCGEKCDGPVGLFVHMARNAHS